MLSTRAVIEKVRIGKVANNARVRASGCRVRLEREEEDDDRQAAHRRVEIGTPKLSIERPGQRLIRFAAGALPGRR